MKVLMIHNEYGVFSGEEVMFYQIAELLRKNGHEVFLFTKSSRNIMSSAAGKIKAFFSGIYCDSSRREIRRVLGECKPDIVQVQNLYPLISPSVLLEIRDHRIPIIMRCANYRLICPNGLLLRDGRICSQCTGGREYRCALTRCEGSLGKSLGYALRNYAARKGKWYQNTVSYFYTQTHFQKRMLIQNGYNPSTIVTIPNMVDCPEKGLDDSGLHVGYVGRLSREKGVDVLLEAAQQLDSVPFALAGSLAPGYDKASFGTNTRYLGVLPKSQIGSLLNQSRFTVVPSICYEGFPSTILESMAHGRPVICSNIGGLPEIVQDGQTGLLFEPGNARQLADKIMYLWSHPQVCRQMGRIAHNYVRQMYSKDLYYVRLISLYNRALGFSLEQESVRNQTMNPPSCLSGV